MSRRANKRVQNSALSAIYEKPKVNIMRQMFCAAQMKQLDGRMPHFDLQPILISIKSLILEYYDSRRCRKVKFKMHQKFPVATSHLSLFQTDLSVPLATWQFSENIVSSAFFRKHLLQAFFMEIVQNLKSLLALSVPCCHPVFLHWLKTPNIWDM